MIYFITGNQGKFVETKAFLQGIELEQLDIDLPEIQELDPKKIVKAKLLEAVNHQSGEFIVEDGFLSLACLNGLPGPFIKWFMVTLGNEGLYNLTKKLGNNQAEAKVFMGYAKNSEGVYYFEGSIKGTIVKPQGDQGFGWDPIFMPDGFDRTFAQMSTEEKNKISMRKEALAKLKTFLDENR